MNAEPRALVWQRAGDRCEYCRLRQEHLPLILGIVESSVVERPAGISLEVVHHPLRSLRSRDDGMHVASPDVNRVEGPAAMFAHALDGGQHHPPALDIQRIGGLSHALSSGRFDLSVRRQPRRIHGVVFGIDRPACGSVEPLAVTGPTDEGGDGVHESLVIRSLTVAARCG